MNRKHYFAHGTKAEYTASQNHSPDVLYWCLDTRELFKGDDLYTDGIRVVDSYASLPTVELAAGGKLYICRDTGCGYLANEDGYDCVLHGIDGQTLGYTPEGLVMVKQVPLDVVQGLASKLNEIQVSASDRAIATNATAGLVKPSTEFSISDDGTLSLTAVVPEKILGLNERLDNLESTITWQSMEIE